MTGDMVAVERACLDGCGYRATAEAATEPEAVVAAYMAVDRHMQDEHPPTLDPEKD